MFDFFPTGSAPRKRCCAIRRLILLLMIAISPVQGGETFSFGIYAADKPTTVVKKFRPRLNEIQAQLSKKLGGEVKIKMQIAPDYSKGVDDIVAGRVDFARLGPASYIAVKSRQPEIRILALESNHGNKHFNGVIVVHRDSPIKSVDDLKGKRFAFGNRRSTIGRYLAQQFLLKAGIRDDDLSGYEYLGRHDKVGWAVAQGAFDAGALKAGTYKKLVKSGAALRVLAMFPNVTKPWVARAGLEEATFQELRSSLLTLGPDNFLSGQDSDFDEIRLAIKESVRFFRD